MTGASLEENNRKVLAADSRSVLANSLDDLKAKLLDSNYDGKPISMIVGKRISYFTKNESQIFHVDAEGRSAALDIKDAMKALPAGITFFDITGKDVQDAARWGESVEIPGDPVSYLLLAVKKIMEDQAARQQPARQGLASMFGLFNNKNKPVITEEKSLTNKFGKRE